MTIPLSQRFEILQRDGFTCRFCGRRATETELEVDHLHPRSQGGTDEPENLVTACRNCNRGKGDRLVVLAGDNPWASLVGKFFHAFDADDGRIAEQGVVLSELAPGVFMVQRFEWMTGHPAFAGIRPVSLREMTRARWSFYQSADLMHDCYRYSGLARRWPKGEDPPEAEFISLAEVAARGRSAEDAP